MKVIELPSLKWFNFGNVFTGSVGTDQEKGCLNSTTFNYKVKITDGNKLTVVCWFMLPWNASTNMEEAVIGLFNADNFGIEIAENWLIHKCFKDYQPPQKFLSYDKMTPKSNLSYFHRSCKLAFK